MNELEAAVRGNNLKEFNHWMQAGTRVRAGVWDAHLIPLLTPIWALPGDLPHAAGVGDLARVKDWFDEAGRPRLGNLSQHHPINNPAWLRNLDWMTPNAQQILDVALAWACVNDRGIDITICDYRWNATAEGWAGHAAKDEQMAQFLARAESAREA